MTGPRVNRTQVAIVGAGPAGPTPGPLHHRAGIETVTLERREREYVEARVRAGVFEHDVADLFEQAGVGERMRREGLVHGGVELRAAGERQRIGFDELTGKSIVVYGQTEIVTDLIAARLGSGAPIISTWTAWRSTTSTPIVLASSTNLRLQLSQLRYLRTSRVAATSLAENYVGIESV